MSRTSVLTFLVLALWSCTESEPGNSPDASRQDAQSQPVDAGGTDAQRGSSSQRDAGSDEADAGHDAAALARFCEGNDPSGTPGNGASIEGCPCERSAPDVCCELITGTILDCVVGVWEVNYECYPDDAGTEVIAECQVCGAGAEGCTCFESTHCYEDGVTCVNGFCVR